MRRQRTKKQKKKNIKKGRRCKDYFSGKRDEDKNSDSEENPEEQEGNEADGPEDFAKNTRSNSKKRYKTSLSKKDQAANGITGEDEDSEGSVCELC